MTERGLPGQKTPNTESPQYKDHKEHADPRQTMYSAIKGKLELKTAISLLVAEDEIERFIGVTNSDNKTHFIVKASTSVDEDQTVITLDNELSVDWIDEEKRLAGKVTFIPTIWGLGHTADKWHMEGKFINYGEEDGSSLTAKDWLDEGGMYHVEAEEPMSTTQILELADALEKGEFDNTLTQAHHNAMKEVEEVSQVVQSTIFIPELQ